jgi:hypothetical protein
VQLQRRDHRFDGECTARLASATGTLGQNGTGTGSMNAPHTGWRERLSHFRTNPSARMRATGTLVLAGGVLLAVVVYLVALSGVPPDPVDPLEGHSRSADRQMGALMGNWVNLTSGWSDALGSPIGKAAGVLVLSTLFAAYFYRVAWVMDDEKADGVNDGPSGSASG